MLFFCIGYSQENTLAKNAGFISKENTETADSFKKDIAPGADTNLIRNDNQPKKSFFTNLLKRMRINKKDTGIAAVTDSAASAPFAFGDFSWLNGNSRKTSRPHLIPNILQEMLHSI